MRDFLTGHVALGVCSFFAITGVALSAAAQDAPAAPPAVAPPAVAPPAVAPLAVPPPAPPAAAPLGYPGYSGYPPPPGYGYQQPYDGRSRRPMDESVPYEGGPIPTGYHLESRPRRGLLISGPIILGVPYVLGVSIAGGQNFPNSTGWLLLPGIGPWIALAARHKNDCNYSTTTYYSDCSGSSNDDATRTSLILSGFMQTGGAIMFIVGLASPKKVIARDFVGSLHWAPSTVGRSGYGGFVWGEF